MKPEIQTTTTQKPRRCKRLPVNAPREMRTMFHKAEMATRRALQRLRETGFTPSPNDRIDKAIQANTIVIMAEAAAQKTVMSGADAYDKAVRRVAAMLPPPSASRLYLFRPSKNDSPAYRKAA